MTAENMTIEEILRIMVEKGASDIYLTALLWCSTCISC